MLRRPLPHVLAAAALASALAPPSARAAWTAPATLARPAAENLATAGNAEHAQAFAWKVTTKRRVRFPNRTGLASYVRVRIRPSRGRLGIARAISSTRELVANPAVGIDGTGNVVAVWTQAGRRTRVMAAYRRRGGRFGRPFELGRTTSFNGARPALVVSPGGGAVVAWNGGDRMRIARRPAGGCRARQPRACFSAAQSYARGTDQAVAMGRGGTTFVVWAAYVARTGEPGTALHMTIAPRSGLFGPAREISTPSNVSQPAVAVAEDGSAVFAWRSSLPAGGEQDAGAPILATVRSASGALGALQIVSTLPSSRPRLVATDGGEAILAWNQVNPTPQNPDGKEVAASLRSIAGNGFAAPVRLSAAGSAAGSVSLAVDEDGNAFAVYSAAGGGAGAQYVSPSPPAAIAHRKPPGLPFGAPQRLPGNFTGASVFAAGTRVTAASGGSGGATLISDYAAG